ncbi:MAG: SDR family NAD(P)-dependent oxidoreductase [Rikenellaceae bacterium]|nr:SDR family NAD(P)-dependent oxidoreductase [Rikenellaceae bacterium]
MNKVILITGISSGIGMETAKTLVRAGHTVYGGARRQDRMLGLENLGVRCMYLDVTDEGSMTAAVNYVLENEGRIDVLINNAGFGIYGTVEDVPLSEARRQLDVNLFGPARLIQLVLPHMRREYSGTIINIASIAGRMSIPLGTWYHASKHALEALSDSLRMEVEQFGIKVVIIEPGIIDTAWWDIAEKNLENVSHGTAYKQLVRRGIGYLSNPGRASKPEVIAKTILKVVGLDNPKPRYTEGSGAKLIVGLKETLSDRVFDKLIKKKMGMD